MVTRASARAKGSNHERSIADYLKDHWCDFIDRRVKTGTNDKGDIGGFRIGPGGRGGDLVVECKNEARMNLGGWVKEAQEEAINAGAVAGIVVAKRRGTTDPSKQYCIMTLGDFLDILAAHG